MQRQFKRERGINKSNKKLVLTFQDFVNFYKTKLFFTLCSIYFWACKERTFVLFKSLVIRITFLNSSFLNALIKKACQYWTSLLNFIVSTCIINRNYWHIFVHTHSHSNIHRYTYIYGNKLKTIITFSKEFHILF
jgi:hypothetical protein